MDAFMPSVLDSPMDMLENSDLNLDNLCSDVKTSDVQMSGNVDLLLECDEDGGSISMQASSDFYLCHEFTGENIQLAITFPNPSISSVTVDDSVSCTLCGCTFHKQTLLFKHLKEAHDVKRNYRCDRCTYAATSSKLLSRHKIGKHSPLKEKKANDAVEEHLTLKVSLLHDKKFLNTTVGLNVIDKNAFAGKAFNIQKNIFSENKESTARDMIVAGNASADRSTDVYRNSVDNDVIHQLDTDMFETARSIIKSNTRSDIASDYVDTNIKDSLQGTYHQCNTCEYTAKSKRLLKYHINTMHNPQRQAFQCELCSYKCRQKRTLLLHLVKHTGANSHCEAKLCHHCHKTFFSASTLKRHLLIHTDEKLFVCSVNSCSKSFKTAGTLGDHRRKVHFTAAAASSDKDGDVTKAACLKKKVKNVICDYPGCGKAFRDKSNLKTHQCSHTGEKPLACLFCSSQYVQKTALDYHTKKCHS